MKTVITTITELKNIILEVLFSKTDKVNKVSNTSVLNALSYGIAQVGQSALKDIALIESQLFPEYASGAYLDSSAERYGLQRLGAIGSSVYIYIYAEEGTIFDKDIVKFISSDGITFVLDKTITVSSCKYIYAKVSSVEIGSKTNVAPLSIITCLDAPSGFLFCTNEFQAVGGRDIESDEEFLFRIENIHNILSCKTLDYLTQIAIRFNSNILKIVNLGTKSGKTLLGIYTQNGNSLSDIELSNLRAQMQEYLSAADISDSIESRVVFTNVGYTAIDLNFQIEYQSNLFSIDEIYSKIQRKLINFVDFRYWNTNKNLQWSDIYSIVKNTEGVLSVPSGKFLVNGGQNNISVNKNLLPRFRSFLIYNLNGESLLDTNSLNYMLPIIYPKYYDTNFDIYF